MKRLTLLLLLSLAGFTLSAQTQQGYVKSLGRPNKKGEALGEVSIRVKGVHNPVLSNADGTFSLLLPGLKNGDAYILQQVQKKGYELNESGLIGRQQAFSDKVQLEIVMVSSAQLEADKQRIEENAYKAAEKNFNTKLEQLKQQSESNLISAEQYHQAVQELQNKFENYQSLIEGLAEHYAHVDYDDLNEKDREINLCIENGELERADSLIRTLFDPIEVLRRNKEALEDLDRKIAQAKGMISKANEDMANVIKQQNKDAEYLYQLYTIALARYDDEKAQYYIQTRAELDTTNGRWQSDAAAFFSSHLQFKESSFYFSRAVSIFRSSNQDYELSYSLFGLGVQLQKAAINQRQQDPAIENALNEAVEIQRRLAESFPDYIEPSLAIMLTYLGEQYMVTQRYEESKAVLKEAEEILRRVFQDNPTDQYTYRLSNVLNTLGVLYQTTKQYTFSKIYFFDALTISRQLAMFNHDYDYAVAEVLAKLAYYYYEKQEYDLNKVAFEECVKIYRKLAEKKPRYYESYLARELVTQGMTMLIPLDITDICKHPQKHSQKEINYFLEAIQYYEEGIEIYKRNISLNTAFEEQYEIALIFMTSVYMVCDTDRCYHAMEELLPRLKRYYPNDLDDNNDTHPYFSSRADQTDQYLNFLLFQTYLCIYKQEPAKSEQYVRTILSIKPSMTEVIPYLATSLLLQGKYDEAEKVYREHKEMRKTFNQHFDTLEEAHLLSPEHQEEVKRVKKLLKER